MIFVPGAASRIWARRTEEPLAPAEPGWAPGSPRRAEWSRSPAGRRLPGCKASNEHRNVNRCTYRHRIFNQTLFFHFVFSRHFYLPEEPALMDGPWGSKR